MSSGFSVLCDGNPVGVGVEHLLPGGMGIGAEDYRHIHFPATLNEIPQGIGCSEPIAAVMEGNVSGIKSNDAAGTEQCTVRMYALEIVEPELRIIVTGIVFNEG
jgi:hypothetical protein